MPDSVLQGRAERLRLMLAGLFVSIGGLSPNEQKTLREVSAGGVVLHRIDGVWHMAAIEPQRSDDELEKRKGKTVWALPKGLVDPGEKANETATREIREETGVEAELITKLTDIKYVYVRSWGDHAKVFKIVSFFLFRYRAGKLGEIAEDMRKEVRHVEWVPLADAARRLSYSGEKKVAKLAQQWVAEHEGDL
jgi:8-oxo-dGTP pyrophosphatase MutT (NUDIX family)